MGVLRSLEEGVPATVEAIAEKMEVLQEGALWFPGGSKEMRVCGRGSLGGAICGRGHSVSWGEQGNKSMWEGSLDGCSCHPVSVPGDTASLQKA